MEVFVARQPIFNKKKEVVAYELLYRSGSANSFNPGTDGDQATSGVLTNGAMLIGLDTLVSGKKAFVNFTEKLILDLAPTLFDKKLVVVEILENIEPTPALIEACKAMKKKGYTLVLDDFVFARKYQPLIELADIIKVDFILTKGIERHNIIKRVNNKNIQFLAEKVETNEDYEQAIKYGYVYFQGYFFSKPVIISGKDIPSQKVNYWNIMKEVYAKDPDFDKLTAIVEKDVSVTYKLLKYINYSGQFLVSRILSVRHALVILGLEEIRKWMTLISLQAIGDDKPDIIIKTSMARAKIGEEIAKRIGMKNKSAEFFLTGMLSMMDVLTDKPMADILRELPISDSIKMALILGDGIMGDVQKLIMAYEKADWDTFSKTCFKIGIQETLIPELYFDALTWVEKTYSFDEQ